MKEFKFTMKTKLTVFFLTVLNFLGFLGDDHPLKETPPTETPPLPTCLRDTSNCPKRDWTRSEVIVATYMSLFNVENLGLNDQFIADALVRSMASLDTKIWRVKDIDLRTELERRICPWIISMKEERAREEFYRALYRISWTEQNGMEGYFMMRMRMEYDLKPPEER